VVGGGYAGGFYNAARTVEQGGKRVGVLSPTQSGAGIPDDDCDDSFRTQLGASGDNERGDVLNTRIRSF